MSRTRSREWQVDITHTPTGNIAEAEVVGQPTRQPAVNGLPELDLPVKKSQKWDDPVWEGAPIEVYYKGQRQNVDVVERVRQQEDTTRIIARGGTELRNVVDTEVKRDRSADVAQDLITSATSYTADTTRATGELEEDVVLDVRASSQDQENALSTTDLTTIPIDVTTEVVLQQSNFVLDADFQNSANGQFGFDYFSGGEAPVLGGSGGAPGDNVSFSFTPQYDIPQDEWELDARIALYDADGDDAINDFPEIEVTLSGADIQTERLFKTIDRGSLGEPVGEPLWKNFLVGTPPADLTAGTTYTVTFEQLTASDDTYDEIAIDVISAYDSRYDYTFDNTVDSAGGYLDGPELYPDSVQVTFDTVSAPRGVKNLRANSTWNDTSNNQSIAVSVDGQTFKSAPNTDTIDRSFADPGPFAVFRATFSRYGSRTDTTPKTGFNGQRLDDHTLIGDLSSAPFVIDQTFNDRVEDALNSVARTGDFVWEFQIDNDGTKQVVFTPNKEREVERDLPISEFSIKKDTAKRIERVIVYGGTNQVDSERVGLSAGVTAFLDNDYLKEGSETVRSTDGTTVYERGVDYTISYKDGTLELLEGGNIPDGSLVDVSYSWKVRADYTKPGVTDPRTKVVEIPEVTTQQLAQVVSARLVQELSVLERTVDLTIPSDVADLSAIDALNVSEVPTDETFQIKTIEGTPQKIVIRAGTRESLDELTTQIQSQLRTVSRKA